MRKMIFAILIFCSISLFSQSIAGTWKVSGKDISATITFYEKNCSIFLDKNQEKSYYDYTFKKNFIIINDFGYYVYFESSSIIRLVPAFENSSILTLAKK